MEMKKRILKGIEKMKNVKINLKVIHNITFTRQAKNGSYIHNLIVVYDERADRPYIVMTKTPKGKYFTHESFYDKDEAIESMFILLKSIANYTKQDMLDGK